MASSREMCREAQGKVWVYFSGMAIHAFGVHYVCILCHQKHRPPGTNRKTSHGWSKTKGNVHFPI